jgi:hypothetical protein
MTTIGVSSLSKLLFLTDGPLFDVGARVRMSLNFTRTRQVYNRGATLMLGSTAGQQDDEMQAGRDLGCPIDAPSRGVVNGVFSLPTIWPGVVRAASSDEASEVDERRMRSKSFITVLVIADRHGRRVGCSRWRDASQAGAT